MPPRLRSFRYGVTFVRILVHGSQGLRMSVFRLATAWAIALFMTGAIASDASAQFGARFLSVDILTAEDIELMNKTGVDLLESGSEGDTAEWSNPTSKSYGTITLRDAFTQDGMDCRRIELVNTPKGNEMQRVWYRHAVCDVPGKGWRYLY